LYDWSLIQLSTCQTQMSIYRHITLLPFHPLY